MTPSSHITCTRRIEFDAAHRVKDHESKCKHLHGHRYVVEATFTAAKLDALGRVVDFGVIKERLGQWIDTNWDHNTILWDADHELGEHIRAVTQQAVFYLPYNPTAEHMAHFLLTEICPALFKHSTIHCIRLRLYETPNCYADAHE